MLEKLPKKVTFPYSFLGLEYSELDIFNPNLKMFEKKLEQKYALGSDSFTIHHGDDYFSFFKRLSNTNPKTIYYYLIQYSDSKLIVGTACAILRNYQIEENRIKFWYLCDLKIDSEHRGHNISLNLLMTTFNKINSTSRRGYLISMDPGSQQIIHILSKIKNILAIDFSFTKLLIYKISTKQMALVERFFTIYFGQISYLSMSGIKDLKLTSTEQNIDMYHLQHGFYGEVGIDLNKINPDATIMFCFPEYSPLKGIMDKEDIKTDITSTIISYKMKFFDWHEILTSDI